MKVVFACRDFVTEWENIDRHIHLREYQIDYFSAGKGRYWLKDNWEEIHNEVLFFVSPAIQHGIECDINSPLDNLSIKFVLGEKEELRGFPLSFRINIPSKYYRRLSTKMKKIVGYYVMERNIPENYLRDILIVVEKLITEKRSTPIATQEKIDKVKNIISQNYSLPLTLSWLSNKVKLNPHYLCRKFKKITGETVFEHLNKIRMENSLRLLQTTDTPIKQIVSECGYKSVYYFSLSFKKYFSMPPGKVRKSNKVIEGPKKPKF